MGVAYKRGATSIAVEVTFRNDGEYFLSGSITILNVRLRVPAPNDSFSDWEYINLTPSGTQGVILPAGGGSSVHVFTFSGLPQNVALGVLEVQYDLPLENAQGGFIGNNGTGNGFDTWEWTYVINDTPTDLQQVPWVDFLQYTCRWAYGVSDSTQAKTTMKAAMTNGMHYANRSENHRLCYNPEYLPTYTFFPSNGGPIKIRIRTFTSDLDSNSWIYPDCTDFAELLRMALMSQSISADAVWHGLLIDGEHVGFNTNLMCRAGFDSRVYGGPNDPLDNYRSFSFGFHVVAAIGQDRFDASSSYAHTPFGALYLNPPSPFQFPGFWQQIEAGETYGLCDTVAPLGSVGECFLINWNAEAHVGYYDQ